MNCTDLPNTFLDFEVSTFIARLIEGVSSKMEILRRAVILNVSGSILVREILIALAKDLDVTDLNCSLGRSCVLQITKL